MTKPKSIYYLDDDSDDLYFFKNAGGGLGHKVTIFSDGHEMLQALKSKTQNPDIIFLDVHMPILNGEEILNVIKNSPELKNIPIVMISGAYPKKLVRQFTDAGANYLMKKTSISDLKVSIGLALDACLDNIEFTK